MNWLQCTSALVLGVVMLLNVPTVEAVTTCSAEITPMDFNSVDPLSGETTATISYRCDTNSAGKNDNVVVTMCFAIDLGSVPGSTIGDRKMANANNDLLSLLIYKNADPGDWWGDVRPDLLEIEVRYPTSNGNGFTEESITVHGRITSDLTQTPVGDYASTFSAARLTYSYEEKPNPKSRPCDGGSFATDAFPFEARLTVKPSCDILVASDMNFSPGGMPLSGTRTGNLTSTSTIDLTCSNRTAWQVGLDEGQNPDGGVRQMCNPGGTCIAYQLNQPDGATPWGDDVDVDTVDGTSAGTAQTLIVNGRVTDQPLTQAGRYTDTVKVILTY